MIRGWAGLAVDRDVPPAQGDVGSVEGEAIGRVTSGCWSPTTGWVVALALLRVDQIVPGTQMFVDHDGWDLRVALHPLPFVLGRP